MSEEMAISVIATGEEAPLQNDESTVDSVVEAAEAPSEHLSEVPLEQPEGLPANTEDVPQLDIVKEEPQESLPDESCDLIVKNEPDDQALETSVVKEEMDELDLLEQELQEMEDGKRGVKRRASTAFSDDADGDFLGFENIKQDDMTLEYNQVLERLEAEVRAATKNFTPVRFVMATPPAPMPAIKRPRKDTGTDGSRPSSALSSRSEDDNPSASPAQRGGRRATTEMSSPLLRIPLERGWKRELVYRAALDLHSRRNADIYYYTPAGKKLRSTREILEHLSGTGLTLENFSFFKEPLGVDDPEKEIIRDAKVIRRVESPIASPAPPVDGKRPHKPKAPKGASPEPATPKSPPAKLRVKSVGSRLSGPAPVTIKQEKDKAKKASPSPAPQTAPATPLTNNNNTAAWKKPRAPPAAPEPAPAPVALRGRSRSARDVTPTHELRDVTPAPPPGHSTPASREVTPAPRDVTPTPVLRDATPTPAPRDVTPAPAHAPIVPRLATPPPQPQPRVQELSSPDIQSPRRVLQPCSLACGAGVPTLSCAACLCMYHAACAGHLPVHGDRFLCKNCRKSTSPPPAPAPTPSAGLAVPTPTPRRVPPPHKPAEKRVTLRMKVSGSSDGSRVWAVTGPRAPAAPRRAALPQSIALLNGKRFIVVPRPAPLPQPTQHVAQ